MSFLARSGSTVTIEAVLTERGREIAATQGKLDVAYFALGDDGIDYTLIDEDNDDPIELLKEVPVLQAAPSGEGSMVSKLLNLPYQSDKVPYIDTDVDTLNIQPKTGVKYIRAKTINTDIDSIRKENYIATLYQPSVVKMTSYGSTAVANVLQNSDDLLGSSADYGLTTSVSLVGQMFSVEAKSNLTKQYNTYIKIEGQQSGDVKFVYIRVAPDYIDISETSETEPSNPGSL